MPIFKCRLIEQHHIAAWTPDFYCCTKIIPTGFMRTLLEGFAEDTDRYSVDESFMLLKTWNKIVDFEDPDAPIRRTLLPVAHLRD